MPKKKEILIKTCAFCGAVFSNRWKNGSLIGGIKWEKKVTCKNVCHLRFNWSKRKEPESQRFWRQVNKTTDDACWDYTGASRDHKGYGGFSIANGKMERAHRTSYRLTHGKIAKGMVVRHRCDRPPCCNPKHLQIGTVADNNKDRDERGRQVAPSGENNPNTKLTSRERKEVGLAFISIPRDHNGRCSTKSIKNIANRFNVSEHTVRFYGAKLLSQAKKNNDASIMQIYEKALEKQNCFKALTSYIIFRYRLLPRTEKGNVKKKTLQQLTQTLGITKKALDVFLRKELRWTK